MRSLITRWFGKLRTCSNSYTPQEVLQRLRSDADRNATDVEDSARTEAVHAAAGEVGSWMALLGPSTEHELGRASDRLPTAVYSFARGRPLEEIGRNLRPLGGAWDAERALYVASCLIAALLNRRAAYAVARSARDTRSA